MKNKNCVKVVVYMHDAHTYRVVIEQGEANVACCFSFMTRGPPYLAQHPLSEYGPRRRVLLTQRRKCAGG
jgi:hypothetical protein